MSEAAQPGIQLLTIEEADFAAIFADSIPRFKNLRLGVAGSAFYIAAHVDGDLVGYTKMYSFESSDNIAYVEVREDRRHQGISAIMREAAFQYASDHTGTILLSPPTDMGWNYLSRQTERLQRQFPGLNVLHQQNG